MNRLIVKIGDNICENIVSEDRGTVVVKTLKNVLKYLPILHDKITFEILIEEDGERK